VQEYLQDISGQTRISIDLITSDVASSEVKSVIENLQKIMLSNGAIGLDKR